MGLLSKLFRKKRWTCIRCGDFWEDLEVVSEVDSPANYAINDFKDVGYKILKCRGCGRYAIVGSHPLFCSYCAGDHDGVLVTCEGKYRTYCTHCSELNGFEALRKDEKGHFIEYYRYTPRGELKCAGITRVKLLPTFSHNELVWK